jgi:hypothetical protein
VKCDICDQEFNNSEELAKHKEQVHAMDESQKGEDDIENAEVPETEEAPEPTGRHVR